MAEYPKIDSPCPIKWDSLPEPGNTFCQRCERNVHNLTAMTETERKAFMASCKGSVCVAYAVKPKQREHKVVWAMAMAATVSMATPGIVSAACDPVELIEEEILVGGVKNAPQAEWEMVDDEMPPADLPVIIDEDFDNGAQQVHAPASKDHS